MDRAAARRRSVAWTGAGEERPNQLSTGKTGTDLWLPVAPQLLEAIAAMQRVGLKTILVTDYGKPFSKAGFGNKMREWCDEAALPQCTAHGLRKAMARRLAESGESQQSIKSVGGWKADAEVTTYTAGVDQRRLASAAIGRLSNPDLANCATELAKHQSQPSEKKN
ncbi:MAG: tyrosine-type recombinase/integrase [Sphingomonas phyllosphaerae]